ncbi:MAG: ATP-binding protein [Holosporaceae bacterium]|jgi:anti-sigma regulatory factor (Ser/Thr protein kinase)|nr:ATP-binding protein [Holosporaceae bacterium]
MLIKIKNTIEEIGKLCDSIGDFCKENDISDEKFHDILLILDEVVTNVISYAYPDGEEHDFTLEIDKKGDRITIKLVDSGIPFDPLGKVDPDVDSSIEERQIGGLGIFIVKQLSEVVEYSRVDDKNQLTIIVSLLNNEANAATKK